MGSRFTLSSAAPTLAVAKCPGCGAQVEFTWGQSAVVVCPYCRHAVGRADLLLDGLGKVADVLPTDSRLRLGARGTYRGVPFRITGRVQFSDADGTWNAWFASLENGRWARILEVEGRYQVLIWMKPRTQPSVDTLIVGSEVNLGTLGSFTVSKISRAKLVAAEGELSKHFRAEDEHRVVRLEGARRTAAILDLPPGANAAEADLFVGYAVELSQLALDAPPIGTERRAHGVDLTCPKCGGAIALRVPEKVNQVACSYCGALLDATKDKLRFIAAFAKMQQTPRIPLGAEGTLEGIRWVVVGWMRRSLFSDIENVMRSEHLLYESQSGSFAWLIEQRGHWKLAKPTSAGDLHEGEDVELDGDYFQRCAAHELKVEEVLGEFYREVYADERMELDSFVSMPEELDCETFGSQAHWARLRYVEAEVVQAAFKVEPMPVQRGVDLIQPWPHARALRNLFLLALLGFSLAALMTAASLLQAQPRVLADYDHTVNFNGPMPRGHWAGKLFDQLVELPATQPIDLDLDADLHSSWATVDVQFADLSGKVVQQVSLAAVDTDEEGLFKHHVSQTADHLRLSALPAGRYHLRAKLRCDVALSRLPMELKVTAGKPLPGRLLYFLLLFLPTVLLLIHRFAFLSERKGMQKLDEPEQFREEIYS